MTDAELWRLYAKTKDRAKSAERRALANHQMGTSDAEEEALEDVRYYTDMVAALETIISADRGRAA